MLNAGCSSNPKTKVAFDSFKKPLLVTTRIYSTESLRTCFELSVLTNTQERASLMCHSDYYAIQYDSHVIVEILKLEVEKFKCLVSPVIVFERKRKGAAMAFGMLVKFFSDPQVQ